MELINLIVNKCKQFNFGGIVLDTGYIGLRVNEPIQIQFYKLLSNQLHSNSMKFILVQPAYIENAPLFTSRDFNSLYQFIDYFSIMTYDYSQEIGANSPLQWYVKTTFSYIQPDLRNNKTITQKLMLGLPCYGYDYNNYGQKQAILNNDYLKLLFKYKPKFEFEESTHEHKFKYNKEQEEHTVYYPTLKFYADRIQIAEELGTGLSFWEVGQGLHQFYDLF